MVCCDLRRSPLPDGFEDDIGTDTDELIRRQGGRAEFQATDVMVSSEMHAVAGLAVKAFGRLDVWVNNAGIFVGNASVVDEEKEAWDWTMSVNVKGTWLGCKAR